jgi:hypothetical protein
VGAGGGVAAQAASSNSRIRSNVNNRRIGIISYKRAIPT